MYAIVETGGKQIKVEVGDKIFVEKLDAEAGKDVTLEKVLFIGGETNKVGDVAKVEKQGLGKKLVVYRYKSKANVRRKHGHRQPFTCLVVKSINA